MPYLIYWTFNARKNLERIYRFLSEKNKEVAKMAIKTIREKVLLLENFPNAGRPAYDLEPEHREVLIPFWETGYVILYHLVNNSIYILAIRHQKEVNYNSIIL